MASPQSSTAVVRYATTVTAVGEMIPAFREQGLLVFFGPDAPQELHDFCLLHDPSVNASTPRPGDVIELDGDRFTVTAVGDVVEANLSRLGHFCLKADGSTTAPLPGDVCVEQRELPDLGVGSTMRILTDHDTDHAVDAADAAGDTDSSNHERAVSGDPGSTAPPEETP
jgi:PTS system glucitol/sorbitol-specific IIA component